MFTMTIVRSALLSTLALALMVPANAAESIDRAIAKGDLAEVKRQISEDPECAR